MSQTPQNNLGIGQSTRLTDEIRHGQDKKKRTVCKRIMWEGDWKLAPRFVLRDTTGLLR